MITLLLTFIFMFPASFIFFALSERMIARHESRVGKQITLFPYIYQTWVDAVLDLKKLARTKDWISFLIQFSIIFFLNLDIEYVIFIYLALLAFMLIYKSSLDENVYDRVESDRIQVRVGIGITLALLCLFACFAPSQSTSLVQIKFSWIGLILLVPFQLSGMILFSEHPFQGMSKRGTWIESARFFAWSLLSAQLFLGGGSLVFDHYLKAAFLYLLCRVVGVYFPRVYHKDLLRVSILYLFPIAGLAWLLAMLAFGVMEGAGHV